MKQNFFAFILMYSVGLLFLPRSLAHSSMRAMTRSSDSKHALEEKETIRKTFNLTAARESSAEIDNIFGFIEVTGGRAIRFNWW